MFDKSKQCWLLHKCDRKDCNQFCIKLYKQSYLFNEALIPLDKRYYQTLRIDSDKSDFNAFSTLSNIQNNINSFVDEGNNLFIHSKQTGNGKTSWAIRLAQQYIDNIWYESSLRCRVLFISVPKLLIELKNNITKSSKYIEHINECVYNADLVIWDDIGTKVSTVFENESLFNIIDQRLNDKKSNIYTSNLSTDELHQYLGDRLYSRIVNNSYNIELKGVDKRNLNIIQQ